MIWQWTPYTVPLVLATLVAVASTYAVGRDRNSAAETWATAVQASILAWAALHLVVVSATTYTLKTAPLALVVPTTSSLIVSVFGFTLWYTGRGDRLTRRRTAVLLSYPVAVAALSVTNGYHGLMFTDAGLDTSGSFVQLSYEWGPAFAANAVVGYALVVGFTYLLSLKFRHSRNVYRAKSGVLLLSILVLVAATVVTTLGFSPFPHYMLLPFSFLLVGVVLVLTTTSLRFLRVLPVERAVSLFDTGSGSLVPLARDVVIEEIDDGIVVMDTDGRVVDTNSTGKEILDVDRAVGRQISDIAEPDLIQDGRKLTEIVTGEGQLRELQEEVRVADGTDERWYDLSITALEDGDETVVGYVALIYDITRQKRREQRLDEFASIISHDLRNPLNVATGHLEFAAKDLDGPEDTTDIDGEMVETIQRSHRRIERLVEDTLTLAREGRVITETEPVSIAETAREAWASVETHEASLVVAFDDYVEGDRGRLLTLFENLFRNSVEHGRSDVTVRVKPLDDRAGFAVVDDDPGIPDDLKDDVLSHGYSTNENGTGLGLSIVSDIVTAHGWQISVTDRESDGHADRDDVSERRECGYSLGVRFEISDVDVLDRATTDAEVPNRETRQSEADS